MQEIISPKNSKIKYLLQLQKKSNTRKEFKEFVIEGKREIKAAIENNYKIKSLFFYPNLFSEKEVFELVKNLEPKVELIKISEHVYKKIAYRNSTEGIIAVAQMKQHSLTELKLSQNPLLLVGEAIEKPGNLGAILRTVDGVNADGLILVDSKVDIYNPNVIRASLGMVFSRQIVLTNTVELNNYLRKNNIKLFAATLQNKHVYYKEDYSNPTAIAVGAEDKGLSPEFRKIADQSVYIPMLGHADSLNVSVAAAVLLYEALKQRLN